MLPSSAFITSTRLTTVSLTSHSLSSFTCSCIHSAASHLAPSTSFNPLPTRTAPPPSPSRRPRSSRHSTIHCSASSPDDHDPTSDADPSSTTPDPHSSSVSEASRSNIVPQTTTTPAADTESNVTSPPPQKAMVPIKIGSFSITLPARSLLYVVPFLWGSFGPAIRFLFAQHPHQQASVFNSERLLLSTLVYVPILYQEFVALTASRNGDATSDGKTDEANNRFAFFPKGAELGIYVFIANIAQVLGLQQTSASRASFLVQLQTVFVPILGTALGVDRIKVTTAISSFVAVAGVLLLSLDKNAGTESSLTGDALEILSACFFSIYIVRLSQIAKNVNPNPLVATKIAVQAVLSIVWAFVTELQMSKPAFEIATANEPWTAQAVLTGLGIVMWTGLMTSALSGWAQTKGQQAVPASEAALIFATQPLWATAIAAFVLGESFGTKGIAGGGLIVLATLVPILAETFLKRKKDDR